MFQSILKLSIPMVVGQLAFASMTFIDTLLMGQLGVAEIAGGGLGSVVYQFFFVVGIGVLVATANLIAFARGEKNETEIHRALLSGVVIVFLLFAITGLLIWYAAPVLLWMGQEQVVVNMAETYLRVVVWSLLPAFGFILLRSLILGIGDPALILPISVIAAALNYPVSYVLMTGQFGLPALGLQGIALGTCIISFGMFISLAWLVYRKPLFKPYPFWRGWQSFSAHQLGETLRLGVPIAMAHAMEIGLFSAAAILIGWLGVQALAAHQVALQCSAITFMIPLGISQAVSVKVGELYGSRQRKALLRAARAGLVLGTSSALCAAMLFWLLPEWLVSLFIDAQTANNFDEILDIAVAILFVVALFQFVDAWQVIIMGALRGFKLGASPTIITIFTYWGVGFPVAYLLLESYGAAGVWAGVGIGLGASALLLGVLFAFTLKRSKGYFSV